MLDLHVQDYLETNLPPDEFSRFRDRYFHDRIKRLKEHAATADYSPSSFRGTGKRRRESGKPPLACLMKTIKKLAPLAGRDENVEVDQAA